MADQDPKSVDRRQGNRDRRKGEFRQKIQRDRTGANDRRKNADWAAQAAIKPSDPNYDPKFWAHEGRRKQDNDRRKITDRRTADRRQGKTDRRQRSKDRRGDPSLRKSPPPPTPNRWEQEGLVPPVKPGRSAALRSTQSPQVREAIASGIARRPPVGIPASQSVNRPPPGPSRITIEERRDSDDTVRMPASPPQGAAKPKEEKTALTSTVRTPPNTLGKKAPGDTEVSLTERMAIRTTKTKEAFSNAWNGVMKWVNKK